LNEQILTNGRIVFADRVIHGSVRIADGRITDIHDERRSAQGVDLDGDLLIPGLIDLHTDNLERHYQPRGGVFWDPVNAVIAHDAQVIGAGITTVFDSLTLGVEGGSDQRAAMLAPLCEALTLAEATAMVKADHRLHLRCEVNHPHIVPSTEAYLDHPLLGMMSLMDHAPGDRQTPDIEVWRKFHVRLFDMDYRALDRYQDELIRNSRTLSPHHRRKLGDIASEKALPLASHDDATLAHVEEAADLAVVITEFPTTQQAATRARELGLKVLMGSPNLIRGGSHGGNVAAGELARIGLLDILSSDYIPSSLLPAALRLTAPAFGWDISAAVNAVTLEPARAVRLDDRGEIAIGKRADLVRVRMVEGRPLIRSVWKLGERVA
jgi:alpha-D-ribose 1-methylphosphonate 5-triphosphate diphosphatase